jgi:hypothetical protein
MSNDNVSIPGQGCGCDRCKEAHTIQLQAVDPEDAEALLNHRAAAALKQSIYLGKRAAWVRDNNLPTGKMF